VKKAELTTIYILSARVVRREIIAGHILPLADEYLTSLAALYWHSNGIPEGEKDAAALGNSDTCYFYFYGVAECETLPFATDQGGAKIANVINRPTLEHKQDGS
jgi:hypothetical protein